MRAFCDLAVIVRITATVQNTRVICWRVVRTAIWENLPVVIYLRFSSVAAKRGLGEAVALRCLY